MNNKKGVATLIIVFIITMILIFMILVWQSRLLLIVHRSVGLADTLAVQYNSESEVNDILGRFLEGYPIPAAGTKSLADGTVMTTEIKSDENLDTLTVSAKRQFASNKVVISRRKSSQTVSAYDQVEIVLGMDCTRSMDSRANPACGGGCISRITAAKQAALTFLDEVLTLPPDERIKYFVGMEVFRIGSKWLSEPTNNLIDLREKVAAGFGTNIASSPACVISDPAIPGSGETSLGSAVVFADDYFPGSERPKKKQIYVLVTDGVPNVSLADNRCGTVTCRSMDGGSCTQQAIDYLTCGIADSKTEWKVGYKGLRNRDVDVYGVTVMSAPGDAREQAAYDATVGVFSNPSFVKKYFNSTNAEELPGILKDILGEISKDVYEFKIQRVVPTL